MLKDFTLVFLVVANVVFNSACKQSITAPTSIEETEEQTPPVQQPPRPPRDPNSVPGGWVEHFSGSMSPRWQVINGGARNFSAANVDLSHGALGLKLSQQRVGSGWVSTGAEVQTRQRYGFGEYTWVMRASSTSDTPDGPGKAQSGSTTAVFNFYNNSETEIDFEIEGNRPETVHFVNWHIVYQPSIDNFHLPGSDERFNEYKFIWYPDRIERYINGVLVKVQTQVVPQTPAYVMMNHWGTCCSDWGGTPTEGDRWMWVRSFSFIPLLVE